MLETKSFETRRSWDIMGFWAYANCLRLKAGHQDPQERWLIVSSTICLAFLLRWTHALLHLDGVHFPSLRPRSPRSAGRFTRRALCGASSLRTPAADVPQQASPLRRFALPKALHPDKNPDNPEATQKFQAFFLSFQCFVKVVKSLESSFLLTRCVNMTLFTAFTKQKWLILNLWCDWHVSSVDPHSRSVYDYFSDVMVRGCFFQAVSDAYRILGDEERRPKTKIEFQPTLKDPERIGMLWGIPAYPIYFSRLRALSDEQTLFLEAWMGNKTGSPGFDLKAKMCVFV